MNEKQFGFWKMRRSGMSNISIANLVGITRQGVSQALLAMDEKIDAPLINMMWETKAYMYANRNKVIEMINMLK